MMRSLTRAQQIDYSMRRIDKLIVFVQAINSDGVRVISHGSGKYRTCGPLLFLSVRAPVSFERPHLTGIVRGAEASSMVPTKPTLNGRRAARESVLFHGASRGFPVAGLIDERDCVNVISRDRLKADLADKLSA